MAHRIAGIDVHKKMLAVVFRDDHVGISRCGTRCLIDRAHGRASS